MLKSALALAVLFIVSACSDPSFTSPEGEEEELWLLWEHFAATGPTESLDVPPATRGGTTTSGTYSGLLALEIEGGGTCGGGWYFDAFYATRDDWATHTLVAESICYSFSGCACRNECGGRSMSELIVFAEGLGDIHVPGGVSAYSSTHSYAVVIDVGPTPVAVTLGVGDCGTWDNSGLFSIRVTPVDRIR